MTKVSKPSRSLSRRGFIKASCAGAAAVGATVCGITVASPDPPAIDLSADTFGQNDEKRILIAYASATGSTAEIASQLGKTISQAGFRTDVKPILERPALDGYQAALLGSAVQYGKWLPEAIEFVQTQQQALQRIPVALFSVHIQNLGADEASRKKREAYLNDVRTLLQPVDEAFFAGRFDRRGAKLMLPKWVARFVPTIDLRDWEKIHAWAQDVFPLLDSPVTSSSQVAMQINSSK